jgi:hypothetical protein
MHGCDLGDADANFVLAEPRAFAPDDRFVRHLDDGGKKKIPVRPAARLKCFRRHIGNVNLQKRLGNCIWVSVVTQFNCGGGL